MSEAGIVRFEKKIFGDEMQVFIKIRVSKFFVLSRFL